MNKLQITWEEIINILKPIDTPNTKIYGVPKGGMILTALLKNATAVIDANEADFILDDLIDSGATKRIYANKFPNKTFLALFDKRTNDQIKNTWIVMPWEQDHPGKEDSIQQNITRQLQFIGEDCKREGLKETPNRVARMYSEIFKGYSQKPEDILTTFDADTYDQIVLLKDIEIYSMCEHHMLPFLGKAHVAYIPNKKVIGISKLARLVDIYAKRLQIQERIGEQVTEDLMKLMGAKGAACIIEATHMCMRMRGVEKQNSVMVTSSLKGAFFDSSAARMELMQLIKG